MRADIQIKLTSVELYYKIMFDVSGRGIQKEEGDMIFTSPHWYLAIFQIFLLVTDFLAVAAAMRNPRLSYILLTAFGVYIIVYKFVEYGLWEKKWPLDFSAITYFLFGFAALIPIRAAKFVSSWSAVLAGTIFIVSVLLVPDYQFLNDLPDRVRLMGVMNHNMLLVGGLLTLSRYPFKKTDILWTVGWLFMTILYTEVLVNVAHAEQGNAMYAMILNGSVIHYVLPDFELALWYYIVYYLFVIVAVAGFSFLILWLNRFMRSYRYDHEYKFIMF